MGRIDRDQEQRDLRLSLAEIVDGLVTDDFLPHIAALNLEEVKREVVVTGDGTYLIDTGVRHLSVTWVVTPDPTPRRAAGFSDDETSDEFGEFEIVDEKTIACVHCEKPVEIKRGVVVHEFNGLIIEYKPYVHPAEVRRG